MADRDPDAAAPWTVGDLRAALEGLADDQPLQVDVVADDGSFDVQVVVSAGFDTVVWDHASGEEPERVWSLRCDQTPAWWVERHHRRLST